MDSFKNMTRKEMLAKMNPAQKKQHRVAIELAVLLVIGGGCLLGYAAIIIEQFCRAVPYLVQDNIWTVIYDGSLLQNAILTPPLWKKIIAGTLIFRIICMCLSAVILCYFVRVLMEISRDNSFSMENVGHFKKISYLAFAEVIVIVLRAIMCIYKCLHYGVPRAGVLLATVYIVVAFIGIIFASLCRVLSNLIQNAYEVKSENDLTI